MWAMPERMKVVAVNMQYLSQAYFAFDLDVPYQLLNKSTVYIHPIKLQDSYKFLLAYNLLAIDKNSSSDVEIIQMSYLQFICTKLINNPVFRQQFGMLLTLCLQLTKPKIIGDERGRPIIVDENNDEVYITPNEFEDIRRIILYQNLIHYDDEYINPELKKTMDEMDALKSKNYEMPNLERKMAIITAHTGISKVEQMAMTLRSHSLLFEEVGGEVDFNTIRPAAIASGHGAEIEHWIYPKKKNKFAEYVTDVDTYSQSMGNQHGAIQSVQSSDLTLGDSYLQQVQQFKK